MNTFTAERNNCRRKLILLVKQHPILWNKTQDNYNRNRPQKLQTWQIISEQIGMSVDKIRRTWENLRDQYRRDLKREVKYGFKSKWRFFNDMDFIRDMVTCNGQAIEFTDSDSEMEPNDMSNFLDYEFEATANFIQPPPQVSTDSSPPKAVSMMKNDLIFQPILLTKQWQRQPNNISDMSSLVVSIAQAPAQPLPAGQQIPPRQPSPETMQKCDSSRDFHQDLPNPLELMEMLAKREPESDVELESECVAAAATAMPSNIAPADTGHRVAQEFHQEAHVSTSCPKQASLPMENNTVEAPRSSSSSATIKRNKSSESLDLDARDEDYYFVMSLLPSMRQIPRNRKIALRIGIMNLIANDLGEVCK